MSDVLVRVVWGEHKVILWQRWEPSWRMAAPAGDDWPGAEKVDDWQVDWRFREGKTMRRAKFSHK